MRTSGRPLRPIKALAVAAVTALTVVGTVTTAPPPADAAPGGEGPTCLGRAATIVGTNRDDTLTGTRGDDVIVARIGDDVVDGRGGDDRICGGGGDDVLRVAGGDDRIDGGYGLDELEGGAGDDLLIGAEDLVDDRMFRGDTLAGGVGDDRMYADRPTDRPVSNRDDGFDTVTYADAQGALSGDVSGAYGPEGTVVRVGDDRDRVFSVSDLVASSFDDRLTTSGPGEDLDLFGGPGDDVLTGGQVNGGLGDDVLTAGFDSEFGGGTGTGGPGADEITVIGPNGTFSAGRGDDVVTSTGVSTFVEDGPGDDTVTFEDAGGNAAGPGTDVIVGSPQDDLFQVGVGDTVSGGGGDDDLRLSEGTVPTAVDGGAGRDTIRATTLGLGQESGTLPVVVDLAAGELTFDGGTTTLAGLEVYQGPALQRSTVTGSDGPDTIRTSCLVDRIDAGGGDDSVFPARGDDVVDAGEGDDLVSEATSRCQVGRYGDDDLLAAGPGTDTIDVDHRGRPAADAPAFVVDLTAGTSDASGSDTLTGFENIIGTLYADVLRGDAGPNVVRSQGGADRLLGLAGDDDLLGNDRTTADGGAGTDACRAGVEVRCETDVD